MRELSASPDLVTQPVVTCHHSLLPGNCAFTMEDVSHPNEDAVSKYKRLLSMARASLETNQRVIAEKDAQIAQLRSALDKLERTQSAQNGGMLRLSDELAPMPRSLVRRVDVDETIWVLTQFDSHPDAWLSFTGEDDLDEFLRRTPGAGLSKPQKCHTPSESAQIEAEAKAKVDRVVEEFRRYKVKAEIARKQISEDRLRPTPLAESYLDGNSDSVSKYKEENQRLVAQLASIESKWKLAYEKIVRDNEVMRHGGGEAMLAAQWRDRYEQTVKEKYDLQERLRIYERGVQGEFNGKSLEEAYNDLREDHRVRHEIRSSYRLISLGTTASDECYRKAQDPGEP